MQISDKIKKLQEAKARIKAEALAFKEEEKKIKNSPEYKEAKKAARMQYKKERRAKIAKAYELYKKLEAAGLIAEVEKMLTKKSK